MQLQDPSSEPDNQFSADSCSFISETIPDTGIRLLRPRPETEPALASQLQIPHRLELLRRQAPLHLTTARLLQDDSLVGTTSDGAPVHLVLTVVVEPGQWAGGWFIAVVAPNVSEAWKTYLIRAREQFVLEVRQGA
jgi:hypothetical protein